MRAIRALYLLAISSAVACHRPARQPTDSSVSHAHSLQPSAPEPQRTPQVSTAFTLPKIVGADTLAPVPIHSEELPADILRGASIGLAIVEARITTDGSVENVRVVKSHSPAVDRAAVQCVSRWRYLPARHKGKAVPVLLTITIHLCG